MVWRHFFLAFTILYFAHFCSSIFVWHSMFSLIGNLLSLSLVKVSADCEFFLQRKYIKSSYSCLSLSLKYFWISMDFSFRSIQNSNIFIIEHVYIIILLKALGAIYWYFFTNDLQYLQLLNHQQYIIFHSIFDKVH